MAKHSCCLAGILCNGMLYVANAGDSRAVLGKQVDKTEKAFMPVRLSKDHNANNESVREDLIALVPSDPNIVGIYKDNKDYMYTQS
ncbi:putative PPM-type phosphatase domain-containing protein [Helianthus debilis subsp. tardiflorus]